MSQVQLRSVFCKLPKICESRKRWQRLSQVAHRPTDRTAQDGFCPCEAVVPNMRASPRYSDDSFCVGLAFRRGQDSPEAKHPILAPSIRANPKPLMPYAEGIKSSRVLRGVKMSMPSRMPDMVKRCYFPTRDSMEARIGQRDPIYRAVPGAEYSTPCICCTGAAALGIHWPCCCCTGASARSDGSVV